MAPGRCSEGGSRLPGWLVLDTGWAGSPGQGHVGGWTSTNKDLHPQLPLCMESFSFKIMTRKKNPCHLSEIFQAFWVFPCD